MTKIEDNEAAFLTEANELHKKSIIIDSHCDTPMCFFDGIDLEKGEKTVKVDFKKMQNGLVDTVFMATYIEQGSLDGKSTVLATKTAFETIKEIKKQLAKSQKVVQARTPNEIIANKNAGKHSLVLALENGYAIGTDIAKIEQFFDQGIRYITLCHNGDNAICDSAKGCNTHGGVSIFGKKVVREMNRLGMMVDLSHANEKSFFDAAEIAEKPLIFSHSSAKKLCNHPRNASDEQLKLLAEMGGVCQVCLYPPFLTGNDSATVRDAVDHIAYIANLIGTEFVGIGSDFDGGGGICGCQNAAEMPKITAEMLRRGFSHEEITKIWGGNLLRVFGKNLK